MDPVRKLGIGVHLRSHLASRYSLYLRVHLAIIYIYIYV